MDKRFLKFEFEFENPFIIVLAFAFANCQVYKYSWKFNEALILGPICQNLYFRSIILKHWCQFHFKHLQILAHEQNFKYINPMRF